MLEFSDSIPFLKDDYIKILENHYSFLSSVKKIRNKFEHKMHGARLTAGGCVKGEVNSDVTYTVEQEEIDLTSGEMISFIKKLNELFAKIQDLVGQYTREADKEYYQYYRRLLHFSFRDFNRIYESKELYYFGKSLYPF